MMRRPAHNRILLILLPLFLTAGCSGLFFYPSKTLVKNPALERFDRKDVFFNTPDDVTLHGWLIQTPARPRGTVVFFHGNAGNMSTHVNNMLWLVPEGYDLFVFDYRGYGRSGGSPTLQGVNTDGKAALEKALSVARPGPVIVLGQSLGGAIAVYAAANAPDKAVLKAVVIDSAFADYREIVRDKLREFIITWPFQYPVSIFFNDDFSPVEWIKKISPVPVLLTHGTLDRVVPFHHGEELYGAALSPREFWPVEGKGHIAGFTDKTMRERLLRYLETKGAP
jgi:uncharacterized protein